MWQQAPNKKQHRKLKILLSLCAALLIGFFVYKYAYIYIERQKYDKAGVAIAKVADDLRAQGIETSPYKECVHAQVKYGSGFLTCSTGIRYEGNEVTKPIKISLGLLTDSALKNGFSLVKSNGLSTTRNPIVVGSSTYTLKEDSLQCALSYDKVDDSLSPYTLSFECGHSSKFKLF